VRNGGKDKVHSLTMFLELVRHMHRLDKAESEKVEDGVRAGSRLLIHRLDCRR
jgi:hypothetical protein